MLEVEGNRFQNSFELFLSMLKKFQPQLKEEESTQQQKTANKKVLVISNDLKKYKMIHGSQFKDILDPRDRVLQHDFNIQLDLSKLKNQEKEFQFTGSELNEELLGKIKIFIVEAVSNIVSIAFNDLNCGRLDEKEAMQYAAKNIMLNIQSIFRQTIKSIQSNQRLMKHVNIEKTKNSLIIQIEQILDNVLINLADSYPQAPASGGTPRMKEVINEVNHTDNEQNDLIYSNNLLISKYLKLVIGKSRDNQLTQKIEFQNKDYTEFIMEVINAAIQASQNNEEDSRERTVKEIFTEFNQKLFCLAQNKKFKGIISGLDQGAEVTNEEQSKEERILKNRKIKEKIYRYFDVTLERNKEALQRYIQSKEQKEFINESETGLEELRREKKYLIGQKIPSFVTVFSRQDIVNKNFIARHSSVLRILTKWAQYLQDTFKNAEVSIKQRLYPFKNIKNQVVFIKEASEKDRLIRQLKEEYREVKMKFNQILTKNSEFIAQFLMAQPDKFISNVSRYSSTRTASSKINAVLTSLMLEYTSILIHHLLRAGRQILTSKREQNINLIVFRVSDLLRAKLQCSETSFINILKTIYLLDSNESMRKKFKLIRIKNKLDDPANNIIINFQFMSKIQCELQLSIQEPKGKQKHYYIFSHFVYELTRGRFGPIAECAIMTSQLDPMIAACKNNYYEEKQKKRLIMKDQFCLESKCRTVRSEEDVGEQNQLMGNQVQQNQEVLYQKNSIFQCVQCKKLIINESSQIFVVKGNQSMCNKCIAEFKQAENELANCQLQAVILQGLEEGSLRKLRNFSEIKRVNNACILSVNATGHVYLNILIEIKKELKVFLVRLNSRVLKEIDSKKFDFSTIDYFNINSNLSKNSKKESTNFQLLYEVPEGPSSLSNKLFLLMNLSRQLVQNKLKEVIDSFKRFREEKSIIKTLKYKAEIISISEDVSKFETFGKIITKLVLKQKNSEKDMEAFRYKRYKHLDLTNLKEIQLTNIELKQIPSWLSKCVNFQKISIQNTKIDHIQQNDIPLSTMELYLSDNKIEKVSLFKLLNLTKLNLDSNNLKEIDLTSLSNLSKVNINNNKLTTVDFQTLGNLMFLSLNNNQLKEVRVDNLSQLKQLHLNNNNIEFIDLTSVINLTKLSLNNNQLVEIDLSALSNLTTLNIHSNLLSTLDLSNLPNLVRVILNQNKLNSINLNNLSNLTELFLDNNELTHLDLTDLISLTRLDLGSNHLHQIDLSNAISLTMLGLDNNQLQDLDLSSLSNLISLDLDNNLLTKIDLSNNTSLSEIYLSNNHLSYLDSNNFMGVSILSINNNDQIEVELSCLVNLKELHVDRKNVVGLDFIQMKNLQKLYVYNGFITEEQLLNLSSNTFMEIMDPQDVE